MKTLEIIIILTTIYIIYNIVYDQITIHKRKIESLRNVNNKEKK